MRGALRDPLAHGEAWRDLVDEAAVDAVAVACDLCFPLLWRGSESKDDMRIVKLGFVGMN
ncbi:hypothetical protein A2U01_0079203 [Trifolium medium]|uniref:Uncharacterized protein n=1 Tax=Trifolium medium TaxID=97028 RepID=A0A392TCK3_9FABA|nr:hypothetical protein [Trifolium medium]